MSGLTSDPGQLTAGVWGARTAVGPLVSRLDCLERKSFTPWSSLTSAHMVQSPVLVLSAPRVGPGSYRGFGQSPSSGEAGSSDDGPSGCTLLLGSLIHLTEELCSTVLA